MKKKVLVIIAVIIAWSVLSAVLKNGNARSGYVFGKAEKTSLTEVVSESGSVASDGNIPVYSPANGTITEIYVDNEQQVQQGDDLFNVISSATEGEKQAAYAEYMAAKAAMDADTAALYSLQSVMYTAWKTYTDTATNSTYENPDHSPKTENRNLTEFTTIQDNWLAAEANYKNQQNLIAKDRAAVSSAYNAYLATQSTTVKAPLDGYVSNLAFSGGNTVQARSALSPAAAPVLILKNSNSLEAVIPVGQTNIAKVEVGHPATIKPDAYKDRTYKGTVVRVDDIGTNTQGVVNYNVYIKVNGDTYLKPGMTADCDIITRKLENVLTVPNSAIVLEKGRKAVRVLENGTLKYIPVLTGVKGDTRTQILSGISEGREIIVSLTNEKAKRPGLLGL